MSKDQTPGERPPWRWNRPSCPHCGSRHFIPIVYAEGSSDMVADALRAAKDGKAIVLRQPSRSGSPQFACARCHRPLEDGPRW